MANHKPHSLIEKILINHSDVDDLNPGDIVNVNIDARVARDFGGANVVNNLEKHNLSIQDPHRTFFTFDCNPGGSDQKYAANQQRCRIFARNQKLKIFDINQGIGTHLAIDLGLVSPGGTFVSTDSHANIIGAIGAFGQGMGDVDIASAWAHGSVWFKVPPSMKVTLTGKPGKFATAKDIVLRLLQHFGANGMLGYAVEYSGDIVDQLNLSDRITIASMATEMGAIITLFVPNPDIIKYLEQKTGKQLEIINADPGYTYQQEQTVNLENLRPMISRPGHPEDVVSVDEIGKVKIDSAFIGSCTNGRFEDLAKAARIMTDRKVAPGVVLKIVPATDQIWNKCLEKGILEIFKKAGALVGNAGCAGCAAGQIGQNGPGEVTISTGNRNYAGKQGKGSVYLASPATVAASTIAGYIAPEDKIPEKPEIFVSSAKLESSHKITSPEPQTEYPLEFTGRVWVIDKDNIDTDMIYHNKHLAITEISEMGQYALGNLDGWQDFPKKSKPGDLILTGKNFGAGSSRQQAVDCFKALGISAIIAESFGAIYERNAINTGFPILTLKTKLSELDISNGEQIKVNFIKGTLIKSDGAIIQINPFNTVQKDIYLRGGLL